jgi:hypothetical protein
MCVCVCVCVFLLQLENYYFVIRSYFFSVFSFSNWIICVLFFACNEWSDKLSDEDKDMEV